LTIEFALLSPFVLFSSWNTAPAHHSNADVYQLERFCPVREPTEYA
jgi:hypothetical protein